MSICSCVIILSFSKYAKEKNMNGECKNGCIKEYNVGNIYNSMYCINNTTQKEWTHVMKVCKWKRVTHFFFLKKEETSFWSIRKKKDILPQEQ